MQRFLVAIVGVLILATGIFLYFKNDSLVKNCTVETEAVVVDMKQEFSTDSDSGATYMYYPILEYKVGDNTIRVTMSSGSSTPQYNIDQKITILYNPNKTKEFIIKGENSLGIFGIVFTVIGVALTGYGIKLALKKN